MKLYNLTQDKDLGRVDRADTFGTRLCGLLFKTPQNQRGALWIVPCRGIHTVGMRYPIDVIFLDRGKKVVKVSKRVRPLVLGLFAGAAYSVVEFFSGTWDDSSVTVGDCLEFCPDA